MKQSFGRGCPVVYHSVLLYFILSMAIVTKCILLEFAPIMPAFCSSLLPSYSSKNYAGKIGASLYVNTLKCALSLTFHMAPQFCGKKSQFSYKTLNFTKLNFRDKVFMN